MEMKLAPQEREEIVEAVNNPQWDDTGLLQLNVRVLLSIDARLEEQNTLQTEMLNNWQAYRNIEGNRS